MENISNGYCVIQNRFATLSLHVHMYTGTCFNGYIINSHVIHNSVEENLL